MGIVSVCRVPDYEEEALSKAVNAHFEALNLANVIRPGMTVLIKPNLIAARQPQVAATTHPALIAALARKLHEMGVARVILADSPGGPYTPAALAKIYAVTGMKALGELLELNEDTNYRQINCPPEYKNRWFNIIEPVLNADVIINVAKLKTHSMTVLSAGIKNLFGCVPGLQKPELHYRHPELNSFSEMLCELAMQVAPAVTILDAVDCMEGNGPTGGTVRHMGLTLAAQNVFEQDAFAARLMGMDAEQVPMLRIARERGLYDPAALTVVGDAAQPANPPFVLPDGSALDFTGHVPAFLRAPTAIILRHVFRAVPVVDKAKCVGCGKCAESCPPHIAHIENGKAVLPRKGCIACLCCQEMCPCRAISVRRMLKF